MEVMAKYTIRAHHGMCLAFFAGKGYSDGFVRHMTDIRDALRVNPVIRLAAELDDICRLCPNNEKGVCASEEIVQSYDTEVLRLCGLKAGEAMEWGSFGRLVEERILKAGKRQEVCGGCQWNEICSEKSEAL